MKVYNFSAGPSMLSEAVKLEVQRDFLNFSNSGMSIVEMSHRSKFFEDVHNQGITLLKEIMNINDDYEVLFLQGGASQQFDAVPLNLFAKGRADYIVTGSFAAKATTEAKKYGDVVIAASSKDKNYTYIPNVDSINFRENLDYVHITQNNTIFGTRYTSLPKTEAPLVSDVSSMILSEEIDISKYGLVYAGAQKNIGPAGLTVVIVKKELMRTPMPICPTMLRYSTHADANSLYNTPPCFCIYMAMLAFKEIKALGGVKEVYKTNLHKASLLYDYIDNSSFYSNKVFLKDRSLMNVPFITPSAELDSLFVSQATQNGLVSLKGHRSVGGMRASIYNAMPVEGVEKLILFMKKFEMQNKTALRS
ncbi:MAG: 3-phosphoserine/phosphohydroxythreonine transaminase [Christensenellaceae bacterium]|jgi:phosphoserine aminotransferase|nr:3-phosphoserine/phosphohydroxythreonine transaminase [Christensenellaceae bacterium]